MNKKGLSKLVAIDKQLIETNIMVSFNEMHGFYYEFQATLSASVCYCITPDQYLFFYFIVGKFCFCGFCFYDW